MTKAIAIAAATITAALFTIATAAPGDGLSQDVLARDGVCKNQSPVSPNRGTRDSSRAPAGRRTDTAEPRRNSHCQAGEHRRWFHMV
jgi:hypothetical protein